MKWTVVVNTSRNKVLARDGRLADSFSRRLIGLLAHHRLRAEEALVLQPCQGIHSMLMRYSFDAMFLDGNGKVLAVVGALPPFRIVGPVQGCLTVVELPEGSLRESGTRVGDMILLLTVKGGGIA